MTIRLLGAILATALALAIFNSRLRGDEGSPVCDAEGTKAGHCIPREDEVWLISTRHLCYQCGTDPTSYELDVRKHDGDIGWREATEAELLESPPLPTVVYVHGNRVSWSESFSHGWDVYQSLAACCPSPAKMRFVIWSWPSDQIRGPLRDIRAKADRADSEAFLFGGFLSQLKPDTQLGLVGYSYGSRVVSGGLQQLAGNSLSGYMLTQPASVAERSKVRVALLAAALDHDWMCSGNCHGSALEQVERFLLLYNSCDPALQRYHLVDRCAHAMALGFVGLPNECAAQFTTQIEQLNVSNIVGRSHDEENYFCSETLRKEICQLLFDPLPAPSVDR